MRIRYMRGFFGNPVGGANSGQSANPLKALSLCVAIACCSSVAVADWRNTQWGMSVPQVSALFAGAVPITRLIPALGEPDVVALLYADPAPAQHATFYFRAGRLVRVDVDYADVGKCGAVEDQLRRRYGPPTAVEKTYEVLTVFSWLDGRDEINLRWLNSGDGSGRCLLMHRLAFG